MRHYVQIVEPMGLPMLINGLFVEDELIECRVHPIFEDRVWERLEFEKDEPLLLALVSLLHSTYDAGGCGDNGFGSNPNDRCRQN
jgi:hypothetical protein